MSEGFRVLRGVGLSLGCMWISSGCFSCRGKMTLGLGFRADFGLHVDQPWMLVLQGKGDYEFRV